MHVDTFSCSVIKISKGEFFSQKKLFCLHLLLFLKELKFILNSNNKDIIFYYQK